MGGNSTVKEGLTCLREGRREGGEDGEGGERVDALAVGMLFQEGMDLTIGPGGVDVVDVVEGKAPPDVSREH